MAPTEPKKARRQAWPPLLHRVVRTIRARELMRPGQHVLVAVSGGPDSVALLSLLHRLRGSWRLFLTAAHFNYALRGAESEEDQHWVASWCRELDVPLLVRRLEVRDRARGTSVQAAARDLRYRALREMAGECEADRIAIGHTADDQAETVLLWMLRGAGLRGLSGMPVSPDGRIIRPLYDSSREEVLAYLAQSGLAFRQDSSNAKPLYARNRIRHEVLPILKGVAPSAVKALCRLADLCREDDRYLEAQVAALSAGAICAERGSGWGVDRAFIRQLPLAMGRRVVRDLLRRCDPLQRAASARTVEQVLHAVMHQGRSQPLRLKSAQVLVKDRTLRVIAAHGGPEGLEDRQEPRALPLRPHPSHVLWLGTGQTITVERRIREQVADTAPSPRRIVADADRVSDPLMVRTWQPGDRFYPWGMGGRSKKLQDYFSDIKVPVARRKRIPIVAAPEGILWIVGYRQDARWAVTAHTRHCLVLTASENSQGEGVE